MANSLSAIVGLYPGNREMVPQKESLQGGSSRGCPGHLHGPWIQSQEGRGGGGQFPGTAEELACHHGDGGPRDGVSSRAMSTAWKLERSFFRSLRGSAAPGHRDVRPGPLSQGPWALALWQKSFLVFKDTMFVVICQNSHGRQTDCNAEIPRC